MWDRVFGTVVLGGASGAGYMRGRRRMRYGSRMAVKGGRCSIVEGRRPEGRTPRGWPFFCFTLTACSLTLTPRQPFPAPSSAAAQAATHTYSTWPPTPPAAGNGPSAQQLTALNPPAVFSLWTTAGRTEPSRVQPGGRMSDSSSSGCPRRGGREVRRRCSDCHSRVSPSPPRQLPAAHAVPVPAPAPAHRRSATRRHKRKKTKRSLTTSPAGRQLYYADGDGRGEWDWDPSWAPNPPAFLRPPSTSFSSNRSTSPRRFHKKPQLPNFMRRGLLRKTHSEPSDIFTDEVSFPFTSHSRSVCVRYPTD